MTALVISFIVGPRMIAWLGEMKIGQSVRDDGPQTHLAKAGTPTMGGALILVSIVVTTLLWGNLANRFVWVVLLVTLGFGAVGWVDDWRKVVYGIRRGCPRAPSSPGSRRSGLSRRSTWRSRCPRPTTRSSSGGCSRGCRAASRRPVAEGRPDRAVLQVGVVSAGRLGLHRAHVLRDRRHVQRGQSDRWARRPRDHADGDGRRARSASSRT